MNRLSPAAELRSQPRQPSPHEIRQVAAKIRRTWSQIERDFRREVGQVQRQRLVATLVRSAA